MRRPSRPLPEPSGSPEPRSDQTAQIESLLRDLGPQLVRGESVHERALRLPVGRPEIDRLLGGGFPQGALSEVSGASSSGRTSLALSLLAATTARGELAGWVDGADAFDPPSAERLGVDLERVLWVRAPSFREALRASERLIQTEGFPLVVLDWTALRVPSSAAAAATWIRLARLAAAARTALLLLSTHRLAGPHAELALEMQPAGARFTGAPSLLEELETRCLLVRSRSLPVDPSEAPEAPVSARSPSVQPLSQSPRSTPAPHESAA